MHVSKRVSHWARNSDPHAMFNILTGAQMFDCVESLLPEHRERLFPPTQTSSMFLTQALSDDGSCQKVVNEAMIKHVMSGNTPGKTNTGAYCKARKRLPLQMLTSLARHSGALITQGTSAQWRWRGRRVRLVDGTTLTMADSEHWTKPLRGNLGHLQGGRLKNSSV